MTDSASTAAQTARTSASQRGTHDLSTVITRTKLTGGGRNEVHVTRKVSVNPSGSLTLVTGLRELEDCSSIQSCHPSLSSGPNSVHEYMQ